MRRAEAGLRHGCGDGGRAGPAEGTGRSALPAKRTTWKGSITVLKPVNPSFCDHFLAVTPGLVTLGKPGGEYVHLKT